MLFKSKVNLGLEVLSYLRTASDQNTMMTVDQLAEKTDKSNSFIEQIMTHLVGMSLVASKRGPGGGYVLITVNGGAYRYQLKSIESFSIDFYPDEGYDEHLIDRFAQLKLSEIIG